jgi:hypothetical protein
MLGLYIAYATPPQRYVLLLMMKEGVLGRLSRGVLAGLGVGAPELAGLGAVVSLDARLQYALCASLTRCDAVAPHVEQTEDERCP